MPNLSPSMRELRLRVTDLNGVDVPRDEVELTEYEQHFLDTASEGEKVPADIAKKVRRRSECIDYRETCITIMSLPKDRQQGYTRKTMKQIESLMDKLDAAKGYESVLLEEGEWKFLRDRVEEHQFPRYSKGVIAFCDSIIDETEKVQVGKVEPEIAEVN